MNKRNMYFESDLKIRSESESESKDKVIFGYFAVFNKPTKLTEGLYEELAPTAFDESLKNNDIRCLFNHDKSMVLGRTGNGTLTLRTDDVGLYGEVVINPNDKQANDIYERVARGDINACSFGFFPKKEEPIQVDDGVKYRVHNADTLEVSIVTFPQYKETEIKARSQQLEEFKSRSLQEHKQNLISRLEMLKC